MIEIKNLRKSYGKFKAVDDLSFTVNSGEVCSFLGVNGAGKTTTLKMLAGILKPSSGQILLNQIDLAEEPRKAKSICGYIPDRPHLYSKLTGREYLYFVADLYKITGAAAEQRIDQLLAEYQLTKWEDTLVESYSHGMKQRLAICAALIHNPPILIVDEPMVGLDPHGAKLLKTLFRRYASEGMSMLISTHSINVAEEISDRIVIINAGQLVANGTVKEIKSLLANPNQSLEDVFIELTVEESIISEAH